MSKPKGERYTVAVDFDGVIHSYTSPWTTAGEIPDPPVPGAIGALHRLAEDFDLVIFTTRAKTADGAVEVIKWLRKNGCPDDLWKDVTAVKPAALIYIDDRAYRFNGDNWPTAQEVHAARPWNKP